MKKEKVDERQLVKMIEHIKILDTDTNEILLNIRGTKETQKKDDK